MGRTRLFLCLISLLCFTHAVYGQSVTAVVDRTEVSIGEAIMLTVTVVNGKGTVDPSPIKNFKVISRGRTQNTQIINGRMTTSIGTRFALIPIKEGTLLIPELNVQVDGKTLKTDAITITVSKAGNHSQVSAKDVFVTAEVSDDTATIGQEIVYTFRLHNAIEIADPRLSVSDFEGFTPFAIDHKRGYRKRINGREYSVQEALYLLIPVEAGQKIIEGAQLNYGAVMKRRQSNDPFDSFFNDSFFGRREVRPQMVVSDPVEVTVNPLPENTESVPYSGLVGIFDMSATLESTELSVGDSVTLAVTIEGRGNIIDVEQPEIKIPDGFKVYEDTPEEAIKLTSKGHTGKKIFRRALVPIKAGTYEIPSIQLNYFDSKKAGYVVKETAAYSITVSPSADEKSVLDGMTPDSTAPIQSLKKKVTLTGRDILPIKEEMDALISKRNLSLPFFMTFLLIPPLIFGITRFAVHYLKKSGSLSLAMSERALKALKAAGDNTLSNEEFVSHLYKALTSIIFSKAGMKGESLTYDEIRELLKSAGYDQAIQEDAKSLLESIESANYSGNALSEKERATLLEKTQALVRSISK